MIMAEGDKVGGPAGPWPRWMGYSKRGSQPHVCPHEKSAGTLQDKAGQGEVRAAFRACPCNRPSPACLVGERGRGRRRERRAPCASVCQRAFRLHVPTSRTWLGSVTGLVIITSRSTCSLDAMVRKRKGVLRPLRHQDDLSHGTGAELFSTRAPRRMARRSPNIDLCG